MTHFNILLQQSLIDRLLTIIRYSLNRLTEQVIISFAVFLLFVLVVGGLISCIVIRRMERDIQAIVNLITY
jgi:hypothetical protein